MPTYLSTGDFARAHGVTRASVCKWIAATPDLRVMRVGGRRLLTADDCQRILERSKKKVGRPKKSIDTP